VITILQLDEMLTKNITHDSDLILLEF